MHPASEHRVPLLCARHLRDLAHMDTAPTRALARTHERALRTLLRRDRGRNFLFINTLYSWGCAKPHGCQEDLFAAGSPLLRALSAGPAIIAFTVQAVPAHIGADIYQMPAVNGQVYRWALTGYGKRHHGVI